jgi:hypothetical protein
VTAAVFSHLSGCVLVQEMLQTPVICTWEDFAGRLHAYICYQLKQQQQQYVNGPAAGLSSSTLLSGCAKSVGSMLRNDMAAAGHALSCIAGCKCRGRCLLAGCACRTVLGFLTMCRGSSSSAFTAALDITRQLLDTSCLEVRCSCRLLVCGGHAKDCSWCFSLLQQGASCLGLSVACSTYYWCCTPKRCLWN